MKMVLMEEEEEEEEAESYSSESIDCIHRSCMYNLCATKRPTRDS